MRKLKAYSRPHVRHGQLAPLRDRLSPAAWDRRAIRMIVREANSPREPRPPIFIPRSAPISGFQRIGGMLRWLNNKR